MNITVNGRQITYNRSGSGRVVVFLHGWGASKENFSELAEGINSRFDVISVDFPGFGHSDKPTARWSVGSYAKFVRDFLVELGVSEVYGLVGHSFGGRVIIKGVSENVLTAQKIVLIGAAGVRHSNSLRNTGFRMIAKAGKIVLTLPGLTRFAKGLRSHLYRAAGSEDYLQTEGVMKQVFISTVNEDLSENATKIAQPVLLIWGSEDTEAPLADARFFASAMPHSRLKIIQEAGHFVHNEKPRKVKGWIESFLG